MKQQIEKFRIQSGKPPHRKVWAKGFTDLVFARVEAELLLAEKGTPAAFDIVNQHTGEIVDTVWQ